MKRRQGGFIDPLSLISLGFLLVTLFAMTAVTSNTKQKQLFNPKASYICRMCMQDCQEHFDESACSGICEVQCNSGGSETGGPARVDTTDQGNTCTEGYINTTGVCCSNGQMERTYRNANCTAYNDCSGPACAVSVIPAQPAAPVQPETQVSTNDSSPTSTEISPERKVCDAEGGTWNNNQCQYPEITTTQPATTCTGTCRWGVSSCADGGWQTAPGSCPTGTPAVCCGGTLVDHCSQGLNYCVDLNTVAVCKIDKSGYTNTPCTGGTVCDSGQNRCVATSAAPANQEEGRYTQQLILPTPVTITKSDYQKCLDTGNTPAECSGVAANIGQKVITPVGKTECDAAVDKPFCSTGNLKTCSSSGTWGLTTCSNGCENGACKPKPAPAIPESVYYIPSALPPQLAAVNPTNDPLSLTQDPMMAVTLNQKIQDCTNKGFTQNQCTQAFQEAADTKDTCVAFYMLENPNADVNQTIDRCTQERTTATLIAAGAYGVSQIPTATLLNTANFADDTTTIIACINGDQNACAYVLPAITNPIPGMSLASQYADELAAFYKQISGSATGLLDDLAWLNNLPNADNPAGWTLDTYGGQTGLSSVNQLTITNDALTGTNFVDNALRQFINSSAGNTLFGYPQIGSLDSMYSFNEYTLTSNPQLPSELSPLETHIKTAADLINQGKYTEAIQLLENKQLAAELDVTIDSGHWVVIPTEFSSTAMTNDDFVYLANRVAGSGGHSPGIVTLPAPGYWPITEDYIWGNPLPEPLVREQATVALEEWVHELQMRNNTLLGIPYTGRYSNTQHEDEIALYLYDTLKMQLSEPFLTRPGYDREILGLPGYNLTNFPNP